MVKQTMTMVMLAAMTAVPAVVGAQQATTPPAVAPGTCDCPEGEGRGDLRNLAAFAPLGLLGAMAAAGGTPALFAGAGGKEAINPAVNVASNTPSVTPAGQSPTGGDVVVARSDAARNPSTDAPGTGGDPSLNRARLPIPVNPDSLRAGLRAPNTGTPLPSVLLLGSGLIAIGCVTVLRTRS